MKTFVDSNILVYAHDVDAGRKREIAASRLRQLWTDRDGVLSTQVLQEFYVNVTHKIAKPVPRREARDLLKSYAAWQVVGIDAADIQTATEIEERHRLGFWDALIVAAAAKASAEMLLSEDFSDGARIGDLRIENPFARGRKSTAPPDGTDEL